MPPRIPWTDLRHHHLWYVCISPPPNQKNPRSVRSTTISNIYISQRKLSHHGLFQHQTSLYWHCLVDHHNILDKSNCSRVLPDCQNIHVSYLQAFCQFPHRCIWKHSSSSGMLSSSSKCGGSSIQKRTATLINDYVSNDGSLFCPPVCGWGLHHQFPLKSVFPLWLDQKGFHFLTPNKQKRAEYPHSDIMSEQKTELWNTYIVQVMPCQCLASIVQHDPQREP